MTKKICFILLVLGHIGLGFCNDTLFTNPNYPPLVYRGGEYEFYKYTPKYAPQNLVHAFKILGTVHAEALENFQHKSTFEVIESGIYYPEARMRKEFCLTGYSDFVVYFHKLGIYDPHAMETFILLSFHQYLNQFKISWKENKTWALYFDKETNKAWKKRNKKLFRNGQVSVKESKPKPKRKKNQNPEDIFLEEFGF